MHASPCLPSHSESSLIHAFRHAQEGCAFALGAPLQDIWQATLPPSIDVDGMWGLHILNDTDVWHTMQTRARYPNRVPDAGVRDTKFSQIGANATWEEMVYKGPGSQLGHQHVSNATNEIPKNVTVFPDAFVYVSNAWKERSCLENSLTRRGHVGCGWAVRARLCRLRSAWRVRLQRARRHGKCMFVGKWNESE